MNKRRNRQVYAVAILALTALVGAAFFSPGWVFEIQDSRQCSDMALEEKENVDVAVLSTNYESSFYQRMINFAENQTENTNYYVASEDLTDYQQLREFLDSENGLGRDSMRMLWEINLITEHIYECEISAWKQYVIYSDDFASGVNFILWYIELEHPTDSPGTYKLLLEANTGEFYGMQADTGGTLSDNINIIYDKEPIENEYSLDDYLSLSSAQVFDEAWWVLAPFYSGLPVSDFYWFYESYYSVIDAMSGVVYMENASTGEFDAVYNDINDMELMEKLGVENSLWINFLKTYPTVLVWDDGNRLEYSFPYGESNLIFRIQMAESVHYPWRLHDITVGFPAIYSLIPEFE